MRGIYEVRSYDGKTTRAYSNYKSAYKFASRLIRNGSDCGIYELKCKQNADGTDDLSTLNWHCVIGC